MKYKRKSNSTSRGRPSVMTPDVLRKLEAAFLLGCTDCEASFAAGIARSTLADYVKKNPEFSDKKKAFKSNPVFLARRAVITAIQNGNVKAAMWFLERKRRNEFGTQTKPDLDVTVDVKPIDLNDWAAAQDAAFMGISEPETNQVSEEND